MPDLPTAVPPAAAGGRHGALIEQSLPAWLKDATPARRSALKQADAAAPQWLCDATPLQRQKLGDAAVASFTAQTQLDNTMAALQSVDAFAEPLLVNALQARFKVQLDVHKTLLRLNKTVTLGVQGMELTHLEALRLPLLQAALHNFEAAESEAGAFHSSSGFLAETAPGKTTPISTTLSVPQFIELCRSLDIGAQYQAYLKGFLYPAQDMLRETFCTAQKTALAAAAHLALLQKHIEPADHAMLLSVVGGTVHPRLAGKPVWFNDLTLMKHRLTGCVAFVIADQYTYADELILYIPNDPYMPLKRHTWASLRALFKHRFTERAPNDPTDGRPSAYASFFSRFVAYADRPDYFSQLTQEAPGLRGNVLVKPLVSLIRGAVQGGSPLDLFTRIDGLPTAQPAPRVPNPDPYLAPSAVVRAGHGLWAENIDLWGYLYDRHRAQLLADARGHAVPTADVDARVRSEKISRLLSIGMLVFNGVAMFVPVLGEVMAVVMAGQLLMETFEGAIEWSEGDRRAAKAHLLDVAENLALLAVMAGAGKGLAKFTAIKPEPLIENLEPVTSADGKARLWKPDLEGYEASVKLHDAPMESGTYHQHGKTYVRIQGKVYEKTFDPQLQRWRIKHPTDTSAYQPLLSHNGAGAWRYDGEQPQAWDRLTLLRRIGHITDGLSNEQLLNAGDISGTSDGALRQMHLDNAPPPACLLDTLRLFKADQGVESVITQVRSGQNLDSHYLYVLPLITEMPRWPQGRVLEVFDGPQPGGASLKYGSERWVPRARRKPAIRISRADVLGSQLPARILAALDENEVNALLGAEPARVVDNRPQEFRKQIADYASTRQPALFESLYAGSEPANPLVAKLQRLFPGLGEDAAHAVLADADGAQLNHLKTTGRVPLALQEQARWYVRQGRLRHAYAGLHRQNLASATSRRLALHTLERLPGWTNGVRLEVRDGHVDGAVLDAIGSPQAPTRKYLVKKGPFFQAFNERGETLNSLPREGDNFFASIMHALPDGERNALGLPHVGQSDELRRAIIANARADAAQSAAIVAVEPRQRWFKPPQRLASGLIGYPASGRGEGAMASLVSRVNDVYPWLTEDQARQYVMERIQAGESDQQIFTHLNNRQREWLTLHNTLEQWVGTESLNPVLAFTGRRQAAQALRASWRASPLAQLHRHAQLNLFLDEPLPPLEADFSHVRTLSLGGRGLTDTHFATVLSYFPRLEALSVVYSHGQLSRVPEIASAFPGLTDLSIHSDYPLDASQMTYLQRMAHLQRLSLSCPLPAAHVLDVSGMPQLRSLTLERYYQTALPTGVLDLPQLQRLDLRGAGINSFPPQMYEPGHEGVWRSLSVDWSRFERESFTSAYDYVRAQPEHLVSQEEMVRDYCQGELQRISRYCNMRDFQSPPPRLRELSWDFFQRWPDARARWEAIEAVSTEYEQLSRTLNTWVDQGGPSADVMHRSHIGNRLRSGWYNGLLRRYGQADYGTALDLSNSRLSQLPPVGGQAFEHVQTLNLNGSNLPAGELPGFINRLSGLRTLSLRGCHLDALALAPGDWGGVEHLDLSGNPLAHLELSSMGRLQTLDLHDTRLQAWPAGVENLAQLAWLDLRNTAITHVPAEALASDRLVLATHLLGTPLPIDAEAALTQARHRVEQSMGLADDTLEAFALQPVPEQFPPVETPQSIARHLLPLEADDAAVAPLTRRLNGWLFIREVRGNNWRVSSQSRRQAALRIIEAWRGAESLSLEGLQLGDVPALAEEFPHVTQLNLAGVRLSEEGSNGFLRAFPSLRELNLNSNLLSELPTPVEGMVQLEHLALSANGFADMAGLRQSLARLPRLQRLDLSQNWMETFNLEGLPSLRILNLSSNRLRAWPEGTLQSRTLANLDLSNNSIQEIPVEALNGEHDALMNGVDLSDNLELSRESLARLEYYATEDGRNGALGMTSREIDMMLDNSDADSETSEDSQAPADEVLPEPAPVDEQSAPWLQDLPSQEQADSLALWNQLEAEPDSARFFHLLARLQETEEYRLARADLSRRVWHVIRAASEDTELRELVFASSSTHGTCIDGRIVTFSDLETRVRVHETLRSVDPARLDLKGRTLQHLSRQLFRLEQVENLARVAARHGADSAEVRLEYRIGLREVLDLPAQPAFMRFGTPLSGTRLQEAAQTVMAAERSDAFYEFLIRQDYWTSYLQERYPEDFAALERTRSQRHDQLEGLHERIDERYAEAARMLDIELTIERNQRLIALSRRETDELPAVDPNRPGTSRDAMNRGAPAP